MITFINQKAEEEIRAILAHLATQDQALAEIHQLLSDLRAQVKATATQNKPGLRHNLIYF
jgi:hypothetical protein